MKKPPRPDVRPPASGLVVPAPPPVPDFGEPPVTVETGSTMPPPARAGGPVMPAELDERTRKRVAEIIARAIAAELGNVRISSVPPPGEVDPDAPESEPPRSSMRIAARGAGKLGKWGVYASGALSLIGSAIVWLARPEYAAPLAQALKLIAGVIAAAAGGGAPVAE